MKKRCVAYCRVSTESDDQLNSLENQQHYFDERIRADPDYEFCGIYADPGVSGTKLRRDEFDLMLHDAGLDVMEVRNATGDQRKEYTKTAFTRSAVRAPAFDLIMVKDTSRFARNVLSEDILRELKAQGVIVFFTEQNLRTDREGDMLGIHIMTMLGEQESRNNSRRVAFGHARGAEKGIINSSPRLYGYRYVKAENRLEIVPEEAEVVRLIFELCADGMGVRRIINELDERGIKTREGRKFYPSSIKHILTQPKYTGRAVRRRWTHGELFNQTYNRERDRSEWLEVIGAEGKVPAIISQELFDACQEARSQRADSVHSRGVYRGKTEFAGVIFCGACGQVYFADSAKGKRHFRCKTKKQQGAKVCDGRNLHMDELEAALDMETLNRALVEAKILGVEIIKRRSTEIAQLRANMPRERIAELREAIAAAQTESDTLLMAFMKGQVPQAQFDRIKPGLDERAGALEAELKTLTMPQEQMADELVSMRTALEQIDALELKPEYSGKELGRMVERVTVYPDSLSLRVKLPIASEQVKLDGIEIRIRTALKSTQARDGVRP